MGQRYLLDTNVILDFMGKKLPVKSEVLLLINIGTEEYTIKL